MERPNLEGVVVQARFGPSIVCTLMQRRLYLSRCSLLRKEVYHGSRGTRFSFAGELCVLPDHHHHRGVPPSPIPSLLEMLYTTSIVFALISWAYGQTYSATYAPSDLPQTSEQGQSGTNQCGSTNSQNSSCQNVYRASPCFHSHL